MRRLVVTAKFQRAYRKVVKRERALKSRIDDVLRQMEADVFSSDLGTHKLSGALSGFWASTCGYDCRVLFSLETDPSSGLEVILLLDIGTHDEVY
jgi:mRNA interferase YafQ